MKSTTQGKLQSGQVTVLIALAMVVVIGLAALVVDGGLLYATRQRLQDVADMAALAAGTALGKDKYEEIYEVIETTVKANLAGVDVVMSQHVGNGPCTGQPGKVDEDENASHNGNTGGPAAFTVYVQVCVNDDQVTVTLTRRDVGFAFAGIFGQTRATVSATATAEGGVPRSISGDNHRLLIMPWGVYGWEEGHPQPGDAVSLFGCDEGDGSCYGKGNFGALVLGKNGADRYGDNVAYGYGGRISVGEPIDIKHGEMAGQTRDGVETLLANHPKSKECIAAGISGVFVVVPVVDKRDKDEVKVAGFAGYCVSESYVRYTHGNGSGGGNDNGRVTIDGVFIRSVIPAELTHQDNGDDDDNENHDYGLRVVHLVPNPPH